MSPCLPEFPGSSAAMSGMPPGLPLRSISGRPFHRTSCLRVFSSCDTSLQALASEGGARSGLRANSFARGELRLRRGHALFPSLVEMRALKPKRAPKQLLSLCQGKVCWQDFPASSLQRTSLGLALCFHVFRSKAVSYVGEASAQVPGCLHFAWTVYFIQAKSALSLRQLALKVCFAQAEPQILLRSSEPTRTHLLAETCVQR